MVRHTAERWKWITISWPTPIKKNFFWPKGKQSTINSEECSLSPRERMVRQMTKLESNLHCFAVKEAALKGHYDVDNHSLARTNILNIINSNYAFRWTQRWKQLGATGLCGAAAKKEKTSRLKGELCLFKVYQSNGNTMWTITRRDTQRRNGRQGKCTNWQ